MSHRDSSLASNVRRFVRYSAGVIDDFTRGAHELRFLWPTALPSAQGELKGVTRDGEDAQLWLCEEGEVVGFLVFEWLKRIVVRRGDRSAVFTVHRRSDFVSRATVVAHGGAKIASIRRSGNAYLAGITTLEQAASGVLTGPHGEVIVRETPVERELIRFKFDPGAPPEVRAAMVGIALLYEHDYRG